MTATEVFTGAIEDSAGGGTLPLPARQTIVQSPLAACRGLCLRLASLSPLPIEDSVASGLRSPAPDIRTVR